MAADNLGVLSFIAIIGFSNGLPSFKKTASYGSLARFKDVSRLYPVGTHTVIAAGGDMSDFQYIQRMLDELIIDEFTAQDGHTLGPAEIHEYLSQVMYARRSKMDPLWNSLLVGGVKDGKKYVSYLFFVEQTIPLSPTSLPLFFLSLKVLVLCRSIGHDILSLNTRNRLWRIYRPTSPT